MVLHRVQRDEIKKGSSVCDEVSIQRSSLNSGANDMARPVLSVLRTNHRMILFLDNQTNKPASPKTEKIVTMNFLLDFFAIMLNINSVKTV